MTKRECGSCRFFERSGIGEMGSCSNERCHDIVGMALVRKHELACRVGWDRDYYESAAQPGVPGSERLPADNARQRSGFQGTRPDDMIVAIEQSRAIPEEATPLTMQSRSRQSHVTEAHRRALERRQLAQQTGADVPARRLEGALPAPPSAKGQEQAPWQHGRSEGVSLPRRVELSTSAAPSATPDTAMTASLDVVPPAPPPPPTGTLRRERTIATTERVYHEPPTVERSGPPGMPAHTPISEYTSPLPAARSSYPAYSPPAPEPTYPPDPTHAPPKETNDTYSPANGDTLLSQGYDTPGYPPVDIAPDNIVAQWYATERHLQRGKRCANCRYFQAAETGDRGWCRNRFAFPTPQLVNPNDLACLSCLGTWWASDDQWWLARADTRHHAQPTPEADALYEEMQEEQARQQPSRRPGTG